MASVTPLPGALAEPITNRRWHGRYPKGVFPISTQRYKRRAEELQRRAEEFREAAKASYDSPQPKTSAPEANCWPFPGIDRVRFYRLSGTQQGEIQGAVRAALERLERQCW